VFGFEMASFVVNVQMYLPWFVLFPCIWLCLDAIFGSFVRVIIGYKLSARDSGSRSIAEFLNISVRLWSCIRRRLLCSTALGWEH
jgi:hypothetical protein